MAKTKTPYFSMSAHGTVGRSITAQKRASSTLLREKPLPAYRYTLLQAYQRWLYEDYAYLWTQQSIAAKQEYATAGSRHHLTGFQYWMKYHLTNLPDIAGMWHLDEKLGAVAIDFSKHANHGVIFGASPISGPIDGAQYFITNDYIEIPTAPHLDALSDQVTIEIFIQTSLVKVGDVVFQFYKTGSDWFELKLQNTPPYVIRLYNDIANLSMGKNSTLVYPNTLYHLALTIDGTLWTVYCNGSPRISFDFGNNLSNLADGFRIFLGRNHFPQYLTGLLDEFRIYSIVLPLTLIKRHSERRYPS